MFGAVLVTGPRQVGKTTMLKSMKKAVDYVTLDDPIALKSAREQGGTFFKDNPPPVFVDEIQYTPEVLKNGAMAGAFFESFVISEILKSYYNRGILDPPLYFYRDRDMVEIDLLIEDNGTLYPLEIKKHADPRTGDVAVFDLLDKIPGVKRGPGGVLCLYDHLLTLRKNDRVIPVAYL